MVLATTGVSRARREWVLAQLLIPAVRDLRKAGAIQRPSRYKNDKEFERAVTRLLRKQLELLEHGEKQLWADLIAATGFTPEEFPALLDAIPWPQLIDRVRYRPSDRGSLELAGSVLVLKSAVKRVTGPNVFPACSKAYPQFVRDRLEELGQLPDDAASQRAAGMDSTVYLVEMASDWCLALRARGLPEGTRFDPRSYPEGLQEVIAHILFDKLGDYDFETDTIVREHLLDSAFEGMRANGRASELPIRVESGQIRFGLRGERYHFVGGELEHVKHIGELNGTAFLDLPRKLVEHWAHRAHYPTIEPGAVCVQGQDCSFLTADDRELPGVALTWAATAELDGGQAPKDFRGIFDVVDPTIVKMAGAEPSEIDYVVANTRVGKLGAIAGRRLPVGLVIRVDQGVVTNGWGLPRVDLSNEFNRRQVIADAELHVQRTRVQGEFDGLIEYLRAAGMQSTASQGPLRREQREGLVLVGDILRTRAALHR